MENESIRSIISQLAALPEENKRELVEQLYEHARSSNIVLIGTTLVLVSVLSYFAPPVWVFFWAVPVLMVESYRVYSAFRFMRGAVPPENYSLWHRRFAVSSLLNAFLFGMVIFFLVPLSARGVETAPIQAFVFVVILGVASGSVNALAPDARISIAYLFLLLAPMPIYLFFHGGSVHVAIGILSIFYFVLQVHTATAYNRILLREYRRKNELSQAQKELFFLSRYDPLTSLKNRRGIDEDIRRLLDEKSRKAFPILFYLDLDNFRLVNNTFGHTVGDKVLVKIAKRLTETLADTCQIYRIGGDEFIVLHVARGTDKLGAFHRANHYGEILHQLFDTPFEIDEIQITMQCSIGIAVGDTQTDDVDRISHYADIAMYQAKRTKSGKPIFFNKALEKENLDLLQLRDDLVNRMKPEQLVMYYQPIVTIDDETLIGAEALVRWQHPNGTLILPNDFIPLASSLKLINTITWWVIDHVLEQIRSWKEAAFTIPDYVSINISSGHLSERDFLPRLLKRLSHYGVAPEQIRLEITEEALVEQVEHTQIIISRLRQNGILCMLDDFGTGYSSIAYLSRFDIATIKLDKAFIWNMQKNPKDLVLTRYIIDLAYKLGYTVITEGIESLAQKEILEAFNSDINYQGYLFSKPLPANRFASAFLSKS